MKRIAFLAMALMLALGASLSATTARPGAQSGDPLQLLPDGKIVIVVDVQKLTTSDIWANSRNPVKTALEKAQAGVSDLGLSLTDVHTAAIGFASSNFNDPTVVVTGSFNQSDLISRLRAKPNVKLASEKYKDVEVYTIEDVNTANKPAEANKPANKSRNGAFAFYDAGTVVAGTLAGVRASIDVKSGAQPGVAQNAKLGAALSQDATAAIRFALELTPAMSSSLQSSQVPLPDFSSVNLIFGSINFATGIDLNATLRNNNADQARIIAERLNGLLGMVRAFYGAQNDARSAPINEALKTITITGNDVDVKITGTLPAEIIGQVLK